MFVNGHFCWALKFAVITNALGIPLALVPLCKKFNQPFKPEGKCQGKNRSVRLKWTCPMSSYKDGKRICSCP